MLGNHLNLIVCMLGNFSCFCCLLTFSILTFSIKNAFRNTIGVSNDLDPNQDRHFAKNKKHLTKIPFARRVKRYLIKIQNHNFIVIFSVHTNNMCE